MAGWPIQTSEGELFSSFFTITAVILGLAHSHDMRCIVKPPSAASVCVASKLHREEQKSLRVLLFFPICRGIPRRNYSIQSVWCALIHILTGEHSHMQRNQLDLWYVVSLWLWQTPRKTLEYKTLIYNKTQRGN